MKQVMISLHNLYKEFGEQLKYGEILVEVDGEAMYYDLYTNNGTVCMDGEICTIINEGEYGYELLNSEGEMDMRFILTEEEFNKGAIEIK